MLWAAIPVRGFSEGKSRLAEVLDAPGRAALNRNLLRRTVSAISAVIAAERVLVVSPSTDVLAEAERLGVSPLRESEASGLNDALRAARVEAARRGGDALLTVACDLPCLEAGDIEAIIRSWPGPRAIILAPDRDGAGTNATLCGCHSGFPYLFGSESAAKHEDAAAALGLKPIRLCRPNLAFDLDVAADYLHWLAQQREPRGAPLQQP